MRKRGPKSGAELSVVPLDPLMRTPPPPAHLTAEQAVEWRTVVAAMPAGYFGQETWPAALGRSRCLYRRLPSPSRADQRARRDRFATTDGLDRYDTLLRAQVRQSSMLIKLATKLRLTQQSRYTPKAASTASANSGKGKRPWE